MKRMLCVAAATLLSVCAYTPASASIWTDAITYDGVPDTVQDNSVSFAFFDAPDGVGTTDTVSTGDIVVGIIKWEKNNVTGVEVGDHAIVVFAAEVTADNGIGSSSQFGDQFLNFSLDASTATLSTLLPTISTSVGGFTPGTLGVVLSGTGVDPTTIAAGSSFTTIDSSYAPDLEFGIVTGSDYFEAELRDNNNDGTIDISPGAGGYVTEYDTLSPGSTIGFESGGFSVLRDFTGPGPLAYLPLPTEKLNGSTTGSSQLVLVNSTTLVQPTAPEVANGYTFADQSFVRLNPVPEPGSLAIFGLMGAAGIAARRRRKK